MRYSNDYPVYKISTEAVAKFAITEQLRLVQSKLDRLCAYVEGKILLPKEIVALVKIIESSKLSLLRETKEKCKRKLKCRNK